VQEFEDAKASLARGEELELEHGEGEYAPKIINAITTGTSVEIHGNLPNRGLIDNLPADAVVEVPVIVDGDGLHPQNMGALPWGPASQNLNYVSVGRLAVEAARTGDPLLVRQAVLVDPNASSSVTPEQIWAMCNDLVAAHGDLLPEPLRVSVPVTWA
jgi:alpha-galactosidase